MAHGNVAMERHAITVQGLVQGVGFRPYVHRLASQLRLDGFVKNRTGSVLIEIEGEAGSLRRFLDELLAAPPRLSQIDDVHCQRLPVLNRRGFHIEPSGHDSADPVFVLPDVAVCADCVAELFDPADRRHRYPLLNCTRCGPRLTIIEGAPYDRQRTTMAGFEMCPACRAEYEDPGNRRFHAQPTACPECGPRLVALQSNGQQIATHDPLAYLARLILHGQIGAVKGLGGFHLVCNACDAQAVDTLRRRKRRDERPLAIMVRNVQAARRLCRVSPEEEDLLLSQRRPIVLLRKCRPVSSGPACGTRRGAPARVCDAVAPGNPFLGVMLPYTPLHYLLIEAVGDTPLVMTSGNRSDEPIAYRDDEAVERLGDVADVFLTHNRPIHVRCDDSVTRIVAGMELPVRRSRGYAPQPIKLPFECLAPILAVGGQWKGAFTLGRDCQAILSHHMGDLDHFDAYRAFERDIGLYEELFRVHPHRIVHDLHPDYASTNYARRRAGEEGAELLGVQHHHAHMASCMAEHRLDEPVIGVVFDGTGYGTDGAIWGGEFLAGDYAHFSRAAHLRYVRLPGGDKAIHEPWRIAVAHLLDSACDPGLIRVGVPARRQTVYKMLERGFNSPPTSSVGRLFDAVAAMAGVRMCVHYEGQAAMELEWLATDADADGTHYPFKLVEDGTERFGWQGPARQPVAPDDTFRWNTPPISIDTRPIIRAITDDVLEQTPVESIARRFHTTIVEIIVSVCERIRSETRLEAVVLSGGVFLNAVITREASDRLKSTGFRVYRHRLVPPGDGGLSLGQLAVAAKTWLAVNNDSPIRQACHASV